MTRLTGWGRIAPTWARVAEPTAADEVAAFVAMYRRLAEFRAVRAEIDAAGPLASDLSRRLGL